MKKYRLLTVMILSSLLLFTACDNNDGIMYDYTPPAPPTNVEALNGDGVVDISWDFNRENDVAGYNIYFNFTYDGTYELIGSTSNNTNYFVDTEALNGEIYYYAVAAYDFNNNESELSYDEVYAAPRPEGYNASIFDFRNFPATAGFSFNDYQTVNYDSDMTDFFFENDNGNLYLNVWDDTDIIDMGPTDDIWDIAFAPLDGWAPDKWVEATVGHTYVIWTWDNHFAKIRITAMTQDRMVFDWAFQTIQGEPMLKMKNFKERVQKTIPVK